ncbi:MAG: lysophospholipid acyltransferase family protein [Chloroflexota bacterium]
MSHLQIPINDPRITLNYPLSETYFHKLIVFWAKGIFRLFMELRVNGVENLPRTGPAVICANHLVMFDVFPLQLALPRMIYFMGKAELFQNKITHAIFRQLGGFPVFRGERDTWAINHSKEILLSGQIVAMFPEGTRSNGKGLALARPGAAKLAIELSCPVVVVSVSGIQNLLRTFPKKTVVEVNIAPQIFAERGDSPLSLTDKIMYTMAENLPIELRGVYK